MFMEYRAMATQTADSTIVIKPRTDHGIDLVIVTAGAEIVVRVPADQRADLAAAILQRSNNAK